MFNKILVPLDGSKLAECILPYVEELVKTKSVKEIILFRVCEQPAIPADYPANMPESWEKHVKDIVESTQSQCSLYLGDVEQRLKNLGVKVKMESCLGKAADEIVKCAEQKKVDLIVMASHGRTGVSRWAFGSVSEKVFRSTCVPILMVRAPGCTPGII
jgi:nucleotide-binding universal stress UspA family protein